jgi:hypothetical protein
MKLNFFNNIVIFLSVNRVFAFFPKNLDGILTKKAVVSNIFNNVRTEISQERLFIELSAIIPYHHHQNNFLFVSLFGTYIFGQIRYVMGEKEQYMKLKKLERYKKIYNLYRSITLFFLFLFFKDVEGVY